MIFLDFFHHLQSCNKANEYSILLIGCETLSAAKDIFDRSLHLIKI